MAQKIEKLKGSRYYGFVLLLAMLVVFYAVFKILTPGNFGSPANLYSYLQSSIIYAVGGCGLYFIVVMGLFDFAVGSNIVLSSIVGVILSKQLGYPGFVLGCLCCGYKDDADKVGAVNICRRAQDEEVQKICLDNLYSHKKLQAGLESLYADRHSAWKKAHPEKAEPAA